MKRSPKVSQRGHRVHLGDVIEVSALAPASRHRSYPTRLNVLLVCDDECPANAVKDHIQALKKYSRHRFFLVNPRRTGQHVPALTRFDAIVIHHSIVTIFDTYLPTAYREAIAVFPGLKVQFLQDEYRWIARMVERMRALGVHVLFSALRPEAARAVYHDGVGLKHCLIFSTLPGYVSDYLLDIDCPPIHERKLHVTYRARELPFWLGRHARQKQEIASGFTRIAERHGLSVDISAREDRRLYGQQWIDLILSGKAVLGTEGGASIFDWDSEIERATTEYTQTHPNASFEEVHQRILAPHEGNVIHRALTPRLLEAIALRTALVLFPGEYAGVLQPWRHYIPLKEDFSNADEVVTRLRDDGFLQELVDRTYIEIVGPGEFSYRTFVSRFDVGIDLALAQIPSAKEHVDVAHRASTVALRIWRRRIVMPLNMKWKHVRRSIELNVGRVWQILPERARRLIRSPARALRARLAAQSRGRR